VFEIPSLKKLRLDHNFLIKIDGKKFSKNLANLVFLDLSDNLIEEAPDELSTLKELDILNLSNNKLKTLPVSYFTFFQSEEIIWGTTNRGGSKIFNHDSVNLKEKKKTKLIHKGQKPKYAIFFSYNRCYAIREVFEEKKN